MPREFSEFRIYTIVQGDKLKAAVGKGKFRPDPENRPWVTGSLLWSRARAAHKGMVVVLGDAVHCNRILYWGVLSEVAVEGKTTRYEVSGMRKIQGQHTPQELVLRSTGKRIAPRFIRPYAICRTPSFLR